MTGGNRLFLIASQSGSDAIDALHRLRIMYESLPEPSVPRVVDNTEQIAFANGSRFESMMATKRAGRGKSAYAVFADEFAFWDWPDEQLAALDAAAQHLYAATTGNGGGDLADTIWQQAQKGIGRWHPVFYPWHSHPDRDDEWYRLNVTEAPEPRLAKREHAATPEDAFSGPEGNFFARFTRSRNVADVDPVRNWATYRCVDFGYRHPACLWVQVSPAGQPFVVAEIAPENVTTSMLAAEVASTDAALALVTPAEVTYCDPAGKAANVQTAESEFEVFRAAGLRPVGRPSGRRDGCVRVMEAIADPDLPLVVSTRCPGLIRAMSQVKPHRTSPEVYDYDHPVYSHPLDALRYFFIGYRGGSFSAPPAGRSRTAGDRGRVF